MKSRLLLVALSAFLALSLIACNTPTSEKGNSTPSLSPSELNATNEPTKPVSVPEYNLIDSDEYVQGGRKGVGYRIAIGDGATEEEMRAVFSDLCSNDSYVLHTVWFYGLASDVETIGSFSVGMLEETSIGSEPQFTPCTYSKELIDSLREQANSQDSVNETRSIPNPSISQEALVPDNTFYPVEPLIFSTTAEENGLGDTPFYITGEVTSRFDMAGYDTIQFSTSYGEVYISSVLVPLDIDEGDAATVYFLYTGLSDDYNCPCGVYIYHEPESTPTEVPLMSLDDLCAAIKTLTKDNFSGCAVTHDDSMITVNVWTDGVAMEVAGAAGSPPNGWSDLRESMVSFSNSISNLIDTVGREDVSSCLNILNDLNHDNVLLSVSEGVVIYDVMAE